MLETRREGGGTRRVKLPFPPPSHPLPQVTVWNKCAARLTGYTEDDTMGRHLVNEFITEDFRASVQEVLDNALQGKETDNFQFPLITKHGARVEVLLNAASRRDQEGRVIGVVGIGQDITARIAQEQEYIRLIDTANAPIFGVDTQGQVRTRRHGKGVREGALGRGRWGRRHTRDTTCPSTFDATNPSPFPPTRSPCGTVVPSTSRATRQTIRWGGIS